MEYGLRRRQVHVELHSGGRRAAAQGTAPDNPPTTLAWRHLGQRLTSKSYGEHRSRPSFKKALNSSGTLFPSHRAFSGPFALLPLNDQVLAARNIGRDDAMDGMEWPATILRVASVTLSEVLLLMESWYPHNAAFFMRSLAGDIRDLTADRARRW